MQPIAQSLQPGTPYPLGAHWDGRGVNFALTAPHALSVVLCVFDESGQTEVARLPMSESYAGIWHGYLEGAAPGLIYGYRVFGTYAPLQGHRFNPNKVLIDPYARHIVGQYQGQTEFTVDNPTDTARIALKAQVVHEPYNWESDAPPCVPLSETVIYELHVKGFTKLNPLVDEPLRGTYAGLAHPAALDYLEQLGVTTLSLLPIHFRADEGRLQKMGLSNYWGYSTIGFFAPETRYWSGRPGTTPISEFRDMVKALHSRGIEVLLDVVYNHTAEMGADGPTLSFRGIDNLLYYRLLPNNLSQYENWSGCGNALNLSQPRVLQMVMDSLRYWVQEMHVDGFRFDLATVLARETSGAFSPNAAFFSAINQDPVLATVKLVAEPWDVGIGGYQLGAFPAGWLEWNDRYRDTMRAFWLHQWPTLGEFALRFAGSSDVFRHSHRNAASSVNFIAAHDGFTLHDLVSYNHKHNQANGEENRDGHSHNHSWNCGIEGETVDPGIRHLRAQLSRALLATLFLSQGTPMLLAGDEMGHTQKGNNNAYCQDNEICWLDWHKADQEMSSYVRRLITLRQHYPALRHVRWFTGEGLPFGYADIVWLSPDGGTVRETEWHFRGKVCMGILVRGTKHETPCLILLNASAQTIPFTLPQGSWQLLLNSADTTDHARECTENVSLPPHAMWLLAPAEASAPTHSQ
ncbi:MAG: glycogen debranching enzyme GlgX [Oxalobacter sp.]|nr:MAG: glycogen debranching enzyme GlgX [Oxalobacter sp.]